MTKKNGQMEPGRYYTRRPGAPYREAPELAGERPDVVVCRRVADYAPGQIPPNAGVVGCVICGAPIAFNPANPRVFAATSKACMQCVGISPVPFEGRADEYLRRSKKED